VTFENVFHITMSVYVCLIWTSIYVRHIAKSVYVCHIVTIQCLVDRNVTNFDTLQCLEVFVTLRRQDMCITLQCEEMFIILQ
jgi:hypothetical protein